MKSTLFATCSAIALVFAVPAMAEGTDVQANGNALAGQTAAAGDATNTNKSNNTTTVTKTNDV
ncbi:MAG: hypothetical protein WCZ66_10045, partial [Sphingomonadaceae bacterium]